MENKSLHKLGIDIGSTTVKVAVLDEQDNLLFSDYERHFANIQETLTSLIQKAFDQLDFYPDSITGYLRTAVFVVCVYVGQSVGKPDRNISYESVRVGRCSLV